MKDAANRRFDPDERGGRVSLFANLTVTSCGLDYEQQVFDEGYLVVAGVDEVGRGSLAGPVVAAACVLESGRPFPKGLNDSKMLTRNQREKIGAELRKTAMAFAFGQVEADEIDRINILQATRKAMVLAIAGLATKADFLLIDALRLPECPIPQRAIIKGDALSASIAAASILAKTYRDDLMRNYSREYPQYSFDENVGYATAAHLAALRRVGCCPLHRRSFHGVLA